LVSLKKENFDFIYALNVLEHIKNDISSLKNWVQYLKPGGLILIYVPAFQVLFSSMDKKVGHFRRYRKSELEAIAGHLNLSIVELKYADSLGFFIYLVYKFIGDKDCGINPGALKIYDKFIFPLSIKLDKFFNFVLGKNVYIVLKKKI
jgi:SAM-dependent methyltransferase